MTQIDFERMFITEQDISSYSWDQVPNTTASMANPIALWIHKLIKMSFSVYFNFFRNVKNTMIQLMVMNVPRMRTASMEYIVL